MFVSENTFLLREMFCQQTLMLINFYSSSAACIELHLFGEEKLYNVYSDREAVLQTLVCMAVYIMDTAL